MLHLKAARAAQTAVHATSAAEPEPATIELPSFGAGVAFKPQIKKAKGGTESQAADRVNHTGLGAHLTTVADMDAATEEGEGDEVGCEPDVEHRLTVQQSVVIYEMLDHVKREGSEEHAVAGLGRHDGGR